MYDPAFIRLLTEAVGEGAAARTLEGLGRDPSVSIRLNPALLRDCPFPGAERVPWCEWGFILPERPVFTLDPLYHAGCYYVQDSSAMFPGELFRRIISGLGPGLRVLDLCAAPGGKTTDMAASLRERFGDDWLLVSNEVMAKRFRALRGNVRTWRDHRVAVCSKDPSAFPAGALFDVILADVPCSGEGMFRKDSRAVEEWSEETVRFCAARSRRIIGSVLPALAPGGVLVFSTCTFNAIENDGTVLELAEKYGAEVLDFGDYPGVKRTRCGYALLPGTVPGEGQWAAALRFPEGHPGRKMTERDLLSALKAEFPYDPSETEGLPEADVDLRTALKYLRGEAITLPDAPVGLITVTYNGKPLGLAKNIGTRCNNLYPKENRILMTIPDNL